MTTTHNNEVRALTRGDAFYTAMRATTENFAELEAWVAGLGTGQEITTPPTGTDPEGNQVGAASFYLDTPGLARVPGEAGDWVLSNGAEAVVQANEVIETYYTPHTADLVRDEQGRFPVWLTLVHACGHVVTALVWDYDTDIKALSGERTLKLEGHPLSPHMLTLTGADNLAMLYETPLTRAERRSLERAARELAEHPYTAPEPLSPPNRAAD